MAKADITDLKNLEEQWQGKAGIVIEKFIKENFKKKVGYLYKDPIKNESTKEYEQYAFASKENFDKWISINWEEEGLDKRNNEYVLFVESLGGETNKTYSVTLLNTRDISQLVSIGGDLTLRVNYSVLKYDPVADVTTKVSSNDKMEILTRPTGSTDSYTLRGTINVASDVSYIDLDLSKFMPSGDFNVLIRVFNAEANESASITLQVINTSLSLSFATVWENPLTSTTVYYRVGGDVDKDLIYSVDNGEEITYPLGTKVELDAGIPLSLGVLNEGVHTIKAYLKVGNTTTKPIESQFLYLKDTHTEGTWVVINEVLNKVTNYTPTILFKYAVYNTTKDKVELNVDILKADGSKFQTIPIINTVNNKVYDLNATLEIAASDGSVLPDIVDTAVKINNGNNVVYNYILKVDNSINYAPTEGATFVLNPKLRSNDEGIPSNIVNSVNGNIIANSDSFTNFGFKTDGWLKDSNGIGFLRVPAHCKLNIPYEPLDQMTGSASTTMEFDVRVFNITDYNKPVLRVCSYPIDEKTPLGLEIRGLDVTFTTKNKTNLLNQTTGLEEGQRAHIAINIVYNLGNRGVNYVKIFVNGVIAREFEYSIGDVFYDNLLHDGINIGGTGADIDVYGIRIYKGLQKSANDIRQDWLAAISSTSKREQIKDANNILGADGRISLDKIKDSNKKGLTKYNYIVVNTTIPAYAADKRGTQKGTVYVHKEGEPNHSGLITNKGLKGQGTSSKTYWKWNFQFNVVEFVDENGETHNAYQLRDDMPWATKLCAKLNFASSQQSHKMGSVNLFNDLWNIVVKGHSVSNHQLSTQEDYRVSVGQDWFFVFEDVNGDGNPVFYGIYTFGPAKGDKSTFGCDNDNYCMIEGSSNGQPLTMYQVPWIDDEIDFILNDEGELDTVNYNGKEQFDYDLGTKDPEKAAAIIKEKFKPTNNFVYLHNPLLKFFSGSFEGFQNAYKENPNQFDTDYQYWMSEDSTTSNHKKYDLVRWNPIDGKQGWVNAGITKENGNYTVLNLAEQLGTPTSALYSEINDEFIKARLIDFRDKVSEYYDIKDMLFCDRFNFIIAASDNNCKNTYHYIKDGNSKITSAGDDLDTIKKTNNIGLLTKPYYVEKHDKSETGGSYWTSANNVLYTLFEQAYNKHFVKDVLGGKNDTLTMEDITYEILSAMALLSDDGTPYGCLKKYYHSIQEEIPAVAYNEVARVIYEDAQVASRTLVENTTDQYLYNNTVSPISQSLGSQLENERDWDRKRMMYVSSYAMYGEFGAKDGGATTGALDFRTKGDGFTDFTFTPAMWMYPSIGQAKDDLPLNRRVASGETFTFENVSTKNDTGLFIRGVNYYSSLGNLFNLLPPNDGKEFQLSGSRLTEFIVDSSAATDKKEFKFTPPRIEINNAPLIKEFIAKGMSETSSALDLSSLEKIELIDLRDSGFTDIKLPSTNTLKKVHLPASAVSIEISNTPNLEVLEIDNASKLKNVYIGNNVGQGTLIKDFIYSMNDKGANLSSLTLRDIEWVNVPVSVLEWISTISELNISGSIHTAQFITYDIKNNLIRAMGSIDGSNGFTLRYAPRNITNIQIEGNTYLNERNKSYQMSINVTPIDGNNNIKLEWFLSNTEYAVIDKDTGVVTVTKVGTEHDEPTARITALMTLETGEVVKAEKLLKFYVSTLKVGDIIFHDGTHSSVMDSTKAAIGICFYIDDNIRLMFAPTNMASQTWGNQGGYSLKLSTNREAYDIPELQNKTNAGSRINSGYINSNNDFNFFSTDTVVGELGAAMIITEKTVPYLILRLKTMINPATNKKYTIGDSVPWGLVNTLKIINHRDLILSDPNVNTDHPEDANYYIPQSGRGRTEMDDIFEMYSQFKTNSGNNNSHLLFYSAASECYAYEPTVKPPLKLADKFKAHHWWLPSGGELGRMCFYHLHRNDDDSVMNSNGEKLNIFKELIQAGILNAFDNGWYWTSCEYSSTFSWYIHMGDGSVSNYGNKSGSGNVRAVAAF